MPQLELLPGSIYAMFADAANTERLTQADHYGLMAALLSEDIEDDERRAIDRMLYCVRRGRLSIT